MITHAVAEHECSDNSEDEAGAVPLQVEKRGEQLAGKT